VSLADIQYLSQFHTTLKYYAGQYIKAAPVQLISYKITQSAHVFVCLYVCFGILYEYFCRASSNRNIIWFTGPTEEEIANLGFK
jgi:hypothetical protein